MSSAARLSCYAEIRDCMKTGILAYYQAHKDLLGDDRSQRAIKESVQGLECIFAVLDKYEIRAKDERRHSE